MASKLIVGIKPIKSGKILNFGGERPSMRIKDFWIMVHRGEHSSVVVE